MIRKILLVDDDVDDIELFQEALAEVDKALTFCSAKNGLRALELLSREASTPDIIFLDINMPEMDGWKFLSELKNNTTYRDVPVIMYSTTATKADQEKALNLRANALYQKPDKFNDLKSLLQQLISRFA